MNAEELLEEHRKYLEAKAKGKDMPPMLIIKKRKEIIPMTFIDEEKKMRQILHFFMQRAKEIDLDWAVTMMTGYMKEVDEEDKEEFEEDYEYGDLEKDHDRQIHMIQVFTKDKKLMGIYDRDTLEEIQVNGEEDKTGGFLSF